MLLLRVPIKNCCACQYWLVENWAGYALGLPLVTDTAQSSQAELWALVSPVITGIWAGRIWFGSALRLIFPPKWFKELKADLLLMGKRWAVFSYAVTKQSGGAKPKWWPGRAQPAAPALGGGSVLLPATGMCPRIWSTCSHALQIAGVFWEGIIVVGFFLLINSSSSASFYFSFFQFSTDSFDNFSKPKRNLLPASFLASKK